MPRLLSIQVGQIQTLEHADRRDDRPTIWTTAFCKSPVEAPVHLGETGCAGDHQADREHHGGIDKAVLAYAAAHYSRWREELPDIAWVTGGFGENLTIEGLDESGVCIGDLWRVGPALLEVSQPRQPCWKLCRRWNQPDLAKRVVQSGRTGWYLRVREGGEIMAGQEVTLEQRPCPTWSIQRAHGLLYGIEADRAAAASLANLPQLSVAWREELLTRCVV